MTKDRKINILGSVWTIKQQSVSENRLLKVVMVIAIGQ